MEFVVVDEPVAYDPFARRPGALPPGFDRVAPEVQAERDAASRLIKAREQQPDGGGAIPTDSVVAGASRNISAADVEREVGVRDIPSRRRSEASRGGEARRVSFEVSPEPVNFDPFAKTSNQFDLSPDAIRARSTSTDATDYVKTAAAGALSGTGAIAQGGGELLSRGINLVGGKLGFDPNARAVNPLQGWVNDLLDSRTAGAKKAEAESQINGELLKPDSWSFGKDPTVKGLALQGLNAMGQMAPNLAVALVTAGASIPVQLGIGATVGGLQALGGGAEEERNRFLSMSDTELQSSALYRELIGKGVDRSTAKSAVAEAAALGGGLGNALPSAGEGAFESFLVGALTRGRLRVPAAFGAGRAGQIATGVVAGGAMGGAEEAIEQVGQNVGSNFAVGGNRSLGEGTLQSFVLGMLAEGAVGGGAGALSKPTPTSAAPAAARVAAEEAQEQRGLQAIQDAPTLDAAIAAATVTSEGPAPMPAMIAQNGKLLLDAMEKHRNEQVADLTQLLDAHDAKGISTPLAQSYRTALIGKLEALGVEVPEELKASLTESAPAVEAAPVADVATEVAAPTADVVPGIAQPAAVPAPIAEQPKPIPEANVSSNAPEWQAFGPDSGTLGIPRADMPQVKAEHRGALVNFLEARGVTHQQEEVPASGLKATQAEFSPAKVEKAKNFEGGDRSILISSDNHIVDGHHQALAKAANGEPIQVIRLNAPIRALLPLVHEFPSSQTADGSTKAAAAAPAQPATVDNKPATVDKAPAKIANQDVTAMPLKGLRNWAKSRNERVAAIAQAEIARRDQVAQESRARVKSPQLALFSRPLEPHKTRNGELGYINDEVILGGPVRRGKNVDYYLYSPEIIPTVKREGRRLEPKKDSLGHVQLEVDNAGSITGLNSLFLDKRHRLGGRMVDGERLHGWGEKVIRAILATTRDGADLKISNILPESRGFWEKMGARIEPGPRGFDDGYITKGSYERQRGPIGEGDSGLVFKRGVENADTTHAATGERSVGRSDDGGRGLQQEVSAQGEVNGQGNSAPAETDGTARADQSSALHQGDESAAVSRPPAELTTQFPADLAANSKTAPPFAALSVSEVENYIARMVGPEGRKIHVAPEQSDLPAEALERMKSEGIAGVRGVYLPKTDEIWVVAGNIRSPYELAFVIMHEGAHRGLRKFFGNDLAPVLTQIWATNNNVRKRTAEYMVKHSIGRLEATEEVLADMARNGATRSLNHWDKLVAFIKKWVANFGKSLGIKLNFTDDMVESLVAAASAAGLSENQKPFDDALAAHYNEGAKFSRTATPEWIQRGSAALQSAAGKVDTFAPGKSIGEKVKTAMAGWQDRLVQGVFDAYAPLKNLDYEAYVLARMTKSADGALEGALLYGKPMLDANGAIVGDLDGRGFLGAMKELEGEHDRFFMWVAGHRSERLMSEGREHLFTADEIKAMKALNLGDMPSGIKRSESYLKAHRGFNSYNRAIMDIAEKTGLIDGAARHLWEQDFYVPYFRTMDDDKIAGPSKVKGLVRQQAFRNLKGGKENLGDLMANTLRNWSHLISASLANQAAVRSLQAAERTGIASVVPSDTKKATYVMVAGKQVHYLVDDPLVLDAISAIEGASFRGLPMKLMGQFKHMLTVGVTASPTFRVRNLMRDSISAVGQNEMSYNIMSNMMKGFKATDRKSPQYAQMLFGGGMMRFGSYLEDNRADHVRRLIDSGVNSATILDTPQKVKAVVGKMWDAWQEFGDRAENINRAAIYKALREQGKTHLDASFAARDSMDFALQGSWVAVRFLNQIVPFLNARAQGLYKLGRAAKTDPKRLGYVTGTVALASMALLLAYKDDEDWKAREDWDRDLFSWFKIGGVAFRIPKSFEVGAIGTLAERSLELILSDEMTPKRFAERLQFMLSNTFSMNPIPQMFKPMIDLYANIDSFSGRQIESMGMDRLSKAERIAPGTSILGRLFGSMGDVTNVSPVQVDYLLRAYFGWVGTHAALAVDQMARPFQDIEKPAMRLGDYFVIGDFVKEMPADQSRYVEEFYKSAKHVAEVVADIKHAREIGELDKALEIAADNGKEVALGKVYASAQRKMGELNKEIRLTMGKNVPAEEKRAKLDYLTSARNQLAKSISEKASAAAER